MKQIIYKGTKLSSFCLGTVQLGMPYGISNTHGQPSMSEAHDILDTALQNGINCFDTAQAYQNSEYVLGAYQGTHPEQLMQIISKIGSGEFSEQAEKSIQLSLKALKSDTLFALLLHDSKLLLNWSDKEENTIDYLKSKKLIKYFGVSIYSEDEFSAALNNPSIDIIQIPFNLFDQRAYKNGWFEKARVENKLIFVRSVFLQGLFFMSNKQLPEKLEVGAPFLKQLDLLAKELQYDIAELALSFVRSVAPEAIVILGCETEQQLLENISLFNTYRPLKKDALIRICEKISEVPNTVYNPALWNR